MKFPVSCILVEDEPLQLRVLQAELKVYKSIKVIGTAQTLEEAYSLILDEAPQAAIMDVRFQGGSIYDLFDRLKEARMDIPLTILVSSYKVEAVEAFNRYKEDVAFFVLKQNLEEHLKPAIDRVMATLAKKQKPQKTINKTQEDYILVKSPGYIAKVDIQDLSYAKVLPRGRSGLISDCDIFEINCTLIQLPNKYPELELIRINKNIAVLKRKIVGIRTSENEIEIQCGNKITSFVIGADYKSSLMDALKD